MMNIKVRLINGDATRVIKIPIGVTTPLVLVDLYDMETYVYTMTNDMPVFEKAPHAVVIL